MIKVTLVEPWNINSIVVLIPYKSTTSPCGDKEIKFEIHDVTDLKNVMANSLCSNIAHNIYINMVFPHNMTYNLKISILDRESLFDALIRTHPYNAAIMGILHDPSNLENQTIQPKCDHKWKSIQGFSNIYVNCEKCGVAQ